MKEITVIRAGALGDVVLTLPAVSALRSAYPTARLRAVGYPVHWGVAGNLADEVQSIDAAAMAPLLTDSPGEPLRQVLGSSDLVVAWTGHDPTSALRDIGVRYIVHTPPIPPPGVHGARWLLQSLTELLTDASGVSFDLAAWRLPYSVAELQGGRARLEELGLTGAVLIHPGAGASWKRWPAARFAATGMALQSHGQRVALLEGPADSKVVAAVQCHATQPFPVIRPMETRTLGAVLSQAPCYLGNDSGVTHLAGAVGTPTVALFGPTDPATWKPLGRTTVLRHCTAPSGPGAGIRVCDDPACLEAITVDEVIEAVQQAIVQNSVENCR
jgi:heptosyltransferase III